MRFNFLEMRLTREWKHEDPILQKLMTGIFRWYQVRFQHQ
jgi:hypothetical protein